MSIRNRNVRIGYAIVGIGFALLAAVTHVVNSSSPFDYGTNLGASLLYGLAIPGATMTLTVAVTGSRQIADVLFTITALVFFAVALAKIPPFYEATALQQISSEEASQIVLGWTILKVSVLWAIVWSARRAAVRLYGNVRTIRNKQPGLTRRQIIALIP